MRFLQKDLTGIDILWFTIGRFEFRWFTDCGEWFIYFDWNYDDKCISRRLSSAGNMKFISGKRIGKK
jgi:hypothetical protein